MKGTPRGAGPDQEVDACRNCGAKLSPDAEWCGLCLTPVHEPEREQPTQRLRPGVLRPEAKPVPQYSRWKGGPNSFGPVTKIVVTIFVVALFPFGGYYGTRTLYLVGYAPIAVLILWGLWRKQQV